MIPVIIMGGILTGMFTPTEAGVIAVAYIVFVAIPLLNFRHLRNLPRDMAHDRIALFDSPDHHWRRVGLRMDVGLFARTGSGIGVDIDGRRR